MNRTSLSSPGSPEADLPCAPSCLPPPGLDRPESARFLCLVLAVGCAFSPLVAVVHRCAGSLPEVAQVVAQLFRTVV